VFQHGFLQPGSRLSGASSAQVSTDFVGAKLGYMSNPNGVAFYGEIGGGYRIFRESVSSSSASVDLTYNGGEFVIGVGMAFKLGAWVRLMPEISMAAGPLSTSPGGNSDTHEMVTIGVTTFVDFAKKH
jgi:hypothetical protein